MQPLALVFYEKLLPGSQLVNRLQALQYRVQAVNNAGELLAAVRREMPMLLLADLAARADIARDRGAEGGCGHGAHPGDRVCGGEGDGALAAAERPGRRWR